MQAQQVELVKDIAELKRQLDAGFSKHEAQHEEEAAARRSGRQWIVGTAIAAATALAGLYPLILLVAHK